MASLGLFICSLSGALRAESLLPFQEIKRLTAPEWETHPFWHKAEVEERMRGGERTIAVSVTTEKIAGKTQLRMKGAGLVRRKVDTTYQIASDFAQLKKWSPYFTDAAYDPQYQQVAVHAVTWALSANSLIQFQPTTCAEQKCLLWEIIAGTFRGLRGGIRFVPDDQDKGQSEISIRADFLAESLPLPSGLSSAVLEAVMQKVALSIRDYVEKSPLPTPLSTLRAGPTFD
jgi:hypothetical protein